MHRESVDLERKQLFDLLGPRRVDLHLARVRSRTVHDIHFRAMNLDVTNSGMLKNECVPLHGKIDQRRGEKRGRNFAARFLDLDIVNLISAAPEMERDGLDMRAVTGNFREL